MQAMTFQNKNKTNSRCYQVLQPRVLQSNKETQRVVSKFTARHAAGFGDFLQPA